jgi:hypothetical protein
VSAVTGSHELALPLRLRRGVLQTPIQTWRHRGGRAVTLIGVQHVGDARYYHALQRLIARHEAGGATVQYEMIRPAPDGEWAAATDGERAAFKALAGQRELLESLLRRYGWAYQLDELRERDTWVNVDITDLELVRMIGPDAILDSQRGIDQVVAEMGVHAQHIVPPLFVLVMRVLALDRRGLFRRFAARRDKYHQRFADAIVTHRNSVAATAALGGGGDIVLVWGADHLAGIGALLRDAEFRLTRTTWMPVVRLPSALATAWELGWAFALLRKDGRP